MTPETSKAGLTIADLGRIGLVSDPQVSASGIAWVQTRVDDDADTYLSEIWLADRDGSHARKLTSGTHRDTNPRWSPDGSLLAFTSNRPPMLTAQKSAREEKDEYDDDRERKKKKKKDSGDGSKKHPNQVWVIPIAGGEARQVTNRTYGSSAPTWSPDGAWFAISSQSDSADDDAVPAPMTNGGFADERVVRDLSYRFDGRGWIERYSHIWKVNVESGKETQLTFGDVFDGSPVWSPSGEEIAFSGNRREDRKTNLSARQILIVPASGGEVRTIGSDDAAFGAAVWSPDGSRIAWIGHEEAGNNTLNDTLWTANADGTKVKNHTSRWDVSIGDVGMSDSHMGSEGGLVWIDEKTIAFLASRNGETQVHEATVSGRAGNPKQITSGRHRISGFDRDKRGYAYVLGTIDQPAELFISAPDGAADNQITHVNADVLADLEPLDAIDLQVTSGDGTTIQAWLIPPRDLDESQSYPVIVQIHGGPHAMYGYDFFHEMQAMAAKGYAVLFCNPRGSAGYGHEFVSCTRANWGDADMPDVIASVEHSLANYSWLDANRLGITGGSYGGYLTNWIVSHDDRFKAAVTQRCVSNFYSFFGTSDIGVNFGEFEFGGLPWSDAELLLKHSPIAYVDKITTPLLIFHSENDLRCPIEQAEQMFVALKYLGREVQLVRMPEESHGLSRDGTPSRRRARLEHIIGWFDTHL